MGQNLQSRLTSQVLSQRALAADCLVRGGIGFGKHAQQFDDGNLYFASEGLVHAVEVEHTVKHPCVALHDSVSVPDAAGSSRQVHWLDFVGAQYLQKFIWQ